MVGGRLGALPKEDRARGRVADAVTTALREAILDGVLEPSAWLREEEIAAEFEVSRTPVREALRRLTDEGLTIRGPTGVTLVAPLTREDILAIYVVRESLEAVAARLAAEFGPPALVEQLRAIQDGMRAALARGDTDEVVDLNLQFHRAIRQATGNPYLEKFLLQVEHAVRRFRRSTYELPGRVETAIAEHDQLVEALAERRGDDAARIAAEHMRRARELRAQMSVRRQPDGPVGAPSPNP